MDRRNLVHSYLRSLCTQWIRKHQPAIYRILNKRANGKYPIKVNGNDNSK